MFLIVPDPYIQTDSSIDVPSAHAAVSLFRH